MRINYYRFPEGVDPHTRYINGAVNLKGSCDTGRQNCRGCTICEEGWTECERWHCVESEMTVDGCTVTAAKKLLREFGGSAWTEHCDRSGGCFEVTPIELRKNNSRFKYNHHL